MRNQKDPDLFELITVMIMIAVIGLLVFSGSVEAHHAAGHPEEDRYVVGLNYLCCSKHHNGMDLNETHNLSLIHI